MIDQDGIERPDDPHAHMVHNKLAPTDKEITADYQFIKGNVFFKLWGRIFRRIVMLIMGPYLKYKYRLKIEGKKNIRAVRRKGCIVTVNHVHNLDNLVIGVNLLHHRKCYFITLKDNINMPFVGFLLRTMGGIPIPTGLKAMAAFENCIGSIMEHKKALIICPEASLWPYYRGIRPFKRGAFRLAVKNEVPILPVVISFRRKLRRKQHHKKGNFKYYFTVHICPPLQADTTLAQNAQILDLQQRTFHCYQQTIDQFYQEETQYESAQLEKRAVKAHREMIEDINQTLIKSHKKFRKRQKKYGLLR